MPADNHRRRATLAALAILLMLLVAVGYAWAPQCGFTNYDDPVYVEDNTHIASGLTWDSVKWAFTTFEGANWHPVTWLSHAIDCQFFGKRPAGHHVMNVVIHAINTILLFGLLVRWTGGRSAAFYIAALFAVHPLHVESVAWASERKDVLSALFFLLTLHAYNSYVERGRAWRYGLVMLWTALGLMSKPMLVTLPPLLLLLDFWPLRRWPRGWDSNARRTWLWLLLEKLPLACMAAGQAAVTLYAQQAMGATHMLGDELSLASRVSNASMSIVAYLLMTVWPVRLAVFYPYVVDRPIAAPILAWLAVLAVSVTAVAAYRRRPYLAVGWFWFLGTLVPVIGLVQVGAQAMADRYTYIPLIGVFTAVVLAGEELATRFPRGRAVQAVAWASVICGLTVATSGQMVYWTNSETLFRHAILSTGKNAVAHDNLGDTLFKQKRYDEAESEFRKVFSIDPRHFHDARDQFVQILKVEHRQAEAIAFLRDIVRRDGKAARERNDLALLLGANGLAEAAQLLREATQIAPQQAEPWQNLAGLLATCRDPRIHNGHEAVAAARKAVELTKGKSAAALSVLADAYLAVDDRVQAADALEKALQVSPHDKDLHLRRVKVYREMGRIDEALKHLSAADEH